MRSLIERLRELGHDVTVEVLLLHADIAESDRWIDEAEAELRALGVGVRRHLAGAMPPAAGDVEKVFPESLLADPLRAALVAGSPDVVVAFDTGILLALRGFTAAPVFGIPGDPRHLVWRYNVLARPWRERRRSWLREYRDFRRIAPQIESALIESARACAASGMFGAQHAAWLRSLGVHCVYLPLPIRDLRPATAARPAGGPLRILHLGGLGTTATRLGLALLVRDVLPRLEQTLGAGNFVLRIAGSGTLSPQLARGLERPFVEFAGFVDDTAAEIAASDVFLVPSPYPVGARTRIAEALSIGAVVVAHRASASGIPELVDGENALLADSGVELAEAVQRIARDPELAARLSGAARATYEQHFTPAIACDVLIRELERIAADVR